MKHKILQLLKRVGLLFVIYIAGPVFIFLTNPHNLPLPLLILPFLWLFAVIICSLWIVYKLVLHRSPGRKNQLNFGLAALVPVLLAILQSIHQLSIKDVVLVVGFVAVAGFYVARLDVGQA